MKAALSSSLVGCSGLYEDPASALDLTKGFQHVHYILGKNHIFGTHNGWVLG